MRKRIYVAGAFQADDVMDVLGNMRRGMKVGASFLANGLAPFVPWLDNQLLLVMSEREAEQIAIHDMYEYSLAWLAVSDALFVLPNSDNSVGTQHEIEFAIEHNIPVFRDASDLLEWLDGEEDCTTSPN